MYQFDTGVNRENTNCLKWDARAQVFGRADVIPLWVADMDFSAPDEVIQTMVDRARHGAFGYTQPSDEDYGAVIGWMKRRHGVDVDREAIAISPGVVDSQRISLSALTQPGDKVIIPTPVYGPFYGSASYAGSEQVLVPLLNKDGSWEMDFDRLETAMKDGAKAMLICNPHNPVGRVWTEAELTTLVDMAHRYGVRLISDEIHADLEMPGHKVTSLLRLDPEAVVLISATKTFNLAALQHSYLLIPHKETREKVMKKFGELGVHGGNLFGLIATTAAFAHGDLWLDELLVYLDETRRCVEAFVADQLPMLKVARLEGTYLMWFDMRALGMDADALGKFMVEKAGVGMNNGTFFGKDGAGFMRMNIATPRKNVLKGLEQIKAAIDTL